MASDLAPPVQRGATDYSCAPSAVVYALAHRLTNAELLREFPGAHSLDVIADALLYEASHGTRGTSTQKVVEILLAKRVPRLTGRREIRSAFLVWQNIITAEQPVILELPWMSEREAGFMRYTAPLFSNYPSVYRLPAKTDFNAAPRHFVTACGTDTLPKHGGRLLVCRNWHEDGWRGYFHLPVTTLQLLFERQHAKAYALTYEP